MWSCGPPQAGSVRRSPPSRPAREALRAPRPRLRRDRCRRPAMPRRHGDLVLDGSDGQVAREALLRLKGVPAGPARIAAELVDALLAAPAVSAGPRSAPGAPQRNPARDGLRVQLESADETLLGATRSIASGAPHARGASSATAGRASGSGSEERRRRGDEPSQCVRAQPRVRASAVAGQVPPTRRRGITTLASREARVARRAPMARGSRHPPPEGASGVSCTSVEARNRLSPAHAPPTRASAHPSPERTRRRRARARARARAGLRRSAPRWSPRP
jgi:hypothetical protein